MVRSLVEESASDDDFVSPEDPDANGPAEGGGPLRPSPPLTPEQKRQVEAARPPLGGDNDLDEEQAATADWFAHIQAGRIEVR